MQNFENEIMIFQRFQLPEVGGAGKDKDCQISLFGLQNIAKNNRKMIKDYTNETCQYLLKREQQFGRGKGKDLYLYFISGL